MSRGNGSVPAGFARRFLRLALDEFADDFHALAAGGFLRDVVIERCASFFDRALRIFESAMFCNWRNRRGSL